MQKHFQEGWFLTEWKNCTEKLGRGEAGIDTQHNTLERKRIKIIPSKFFSDLARWKLWMFVSLKGPLRLSSLMFPKVWSTGSDLVSWKESKKWQNFGIFTMHISNPSMTLCIEANLRFWEMATHSSILVWKTPWRGTWQAEGCRVKTEFHNTTRALRSPELKKPIHLYLTLYPPNLSGHEPFPWKTYEQLIDQMLGKAKLAPGHVAICRRLRCPNSLSRVLSIRNFNSMDSQFGQRRGEKSYQLGNPMDSVKWSGGNPGNPESQHHMHRGSCYWGPATQFQLAAEHGSSVTRSELEISIFARNFSGYQVLDPCGQITQACRTTLSLLQSTTHQFENSGLGKFVSGTCNRNSLMIHMGCQILQEKEASAEMRTVFRGIQWNALFIYPLLLNTKDEVWWPKGAQSHYENPYPGACSL